MPIADAAGKARSLYDARRTASDPPFTDTDPSLTMADGYAVQQELTRLILADGDSIVGYKVGLTSKPMQQMIGVDSPDYGPVLGSTVYRDGDAVSLAGFIQPKIEAEIVFVLGETLRGPGVTVTDAHPPRPASPRRWRSSTRASPTGGSSSPTPSRTWPATARSRCRPRRSAHRLGHAIGGHDAHPQRRTRRHRRGGRSLGDPVAVVAWLANTLGEVGVALEPGHLVMTGALHAAVPMNAGDVFRADFDRLGPVTVRVVSKEISDRHRHCCREIAARLGRPAPRAPRSRRCPTSSRPRPRHRLRGTAGAARERRPARRLEARRHVTGQAGAGRRRLADPRLPHHRPRARRRRAAADRDAHPAAHRTRDRVVMGRALHGAHVTAADVLGATAGWPRHRGARLALPGLPLHDARRGRRQCLGRPVRDRYADAGRGHRRAPRRRGVREERRGGRNSVRRRRRSGDRLRRSRGWSARLAAPTASDLRPGQTASPPAGLPPPSPSPPATSSR